VAKIFKISMQGHAPLPARFFNYQSQPATFLVQPPTSNHSEIPACCPSFPGLGRQIPEEQRGRTSANTGNIYFDFLSLVYIDLY
jgi:hypothetical protein